MLLENGIEDEKASEGDRLPMVRLTRISGSGRATSDDRSHKYKALYIPQSASRFGVGPSRRLSDRKPALPLWE